MGMDAVGSCVLGWEWGGCGVQPGQRIAEREITFSSNLHLHEGLFSLRFLIPSWLQILSKLHTPLKQGSDVLLRPGPHTCSVEHWALPSWVTRDHACTWTACSPPPCLCQSEGWVVPYSWGSR